LDDTLNPIIQGRATQTNTPFWRAVQLSSRVTDYQTHVYRSTRSECLVLIKSTIVRSVRGAASRRYASGARA
jgi:hypothetical protein